MYFVLQEQNNGSIIYLDMMSLDKFLQDGQDPKIVEKIYGKIVDMLMHNESIHYIAVQKKPAVTLLPDSITISNKRIFLCEFTKLGLATNFEIFDWKEIKDIAFKEEIFGSKITVIPFTGENLSIDYIPKVQARRLYQLIKEALEEIKAGSDEDYKETSAKEARPVTMPLREVPTQENPTGKPTAAAPQPDTYMSPPATQDHTYVAPSPTFVPPAAEKTVAAVEEEEDELTRKLKKLKSLYDKQLITQTEYESKKAELLSKL